MNEHALAQEHLPEATLYGRISHPTQSQGYGLERQTSHDVEGWCKRHGFRLAPEVIIDEGVSAFDGSNIRPDRALGQYLARAKRGGVRRGDCLVVENWDRITRLDVWRGMTLINELRQLGIHLGRLDKGTILRVEDVSLGSFLETACEVARGNSESVQKSERIGDAWARKREEARNAKTVLTRRAPAWLDVVEDTYVLREDRARAIRRIYDLARQGFGIRRLIQHLEAEGYPPFGEARLTPGRKRSAFAGRWTQAYVARLLGDRRLIGEYQPCTRGRVPEGPPVRDYYPPVLTPDEFFAGLAGRPTGSAAGRLTKHVNLFGGLVRNARNGDSYIYTDKGNRTLMSVGFREGRTPGWFLPVDVFESVVLQYLREIDVHEVLQGGAVATDLEKVIGRMNAVQAEIADIQADMQATRYSRTLGQRVIQLEQELGELQETHDTLAREARHPLSESWADARSLASLPADALGDPDNRVRLRAALRRIVSEVWLLVEEKRRDKLWVAQVSFRGRNVVRRIVCHYRPGSRWNPPRTQVLTGTAWADDAGLDLRCQDDAAALLQALATWTPPSRQ